MGKDKKVLIIGEVFNETSGGGITLSNLFSKFEKDNLAVIAWDWTAQKNDISRCSNVYQMGYEEKSTFFPLSLFQNKPYSGPIETHFPKSKKLDENLEHWTKKYLKLSSWAILSTVGLNHLTPSYKISDKLSKWIDDFKPDMIYCQLGSVFAMRLVKNLSQEKKLPIVIHTMDDWPRLINRPNLLYFYWKIKINQELKHLFDICALSFSISGAMSEEYHRRYKRDFITFHNPVDLRQWKNFQKKDWGIKEKIKIIYFGGINKLTNAAALRRTCQVIDKINERGLAIELDIYTFDINTKIANKFKSFRNVNLLSPVPHKELPEKITAYDLALIPLNKNLISRDFVRLSMPTKATECMISGVPTIIFADKNSNIFKNAKQYGWAYPVDSGNLIGLDLAIEKIVKSEKSRKQTAMKAISYAKDNFDIEEVALKFKKIITDIQ